MTSALAALVVFWALVAPDDLSRITPGAFLSIPVEGVVGVGLLLLLPARARRWAAVLLGAGLGLLSILKIIDLGFFAALARPFDPVLDWSLVQDGVGFVRQAIGGAGAVVAVVAAAVIAGGVFVLVMVSVLRLSRVVARRTVGAARTVAVLAVAWVTGAVLGVQVVPGVPVAGASAAGLVYDRAIQASADVRDLQSFAAEAGVDPFGNTPGDQLLTGLRGKKVVLTFVESYGRSAIEDPTMAPQVDALLDAGSQQLRAAGFASESAFLTSPTSGGGSWLAQSTLLSGLWIDNQQRYRTLVASHRLTLTGAFGRAGWRTVAVAPGVTSTWPESGFFGYDKVYDAAHLGYHGPSFSWATMPDQYTLSAFDRLEPASPDGPPVMAMIPLVSSHAPWSPLPRLVDWGGVGDGSVFDPMAGKDYPPEAILTRDPAQVRDDYRRSIEYSLNTLISYLENYGDKNLVLVFLGDHQPAPVVTGPNASRDVPITIVARDPAVLQRIAGWGWQEGLRPSPRAPVWRMDAFRNRFLTAFGS